nr:CzcE family metal-binding protein [uncultured Duganella sp.]
MQSIKNTIATLIVAAALAPVAAMANNGDVHTNTALGSAAPARAATRVIAISPTTTSINVDQGDVVTFDVGGKRFTWQFDTLRPSDRFKLSAIAPAEVGVKEVWVYVATNPLYR